MRRITLLCTTHRECGKCNEHELVKILLEIGPQVIFEELRPGDFESLYTDESKHSMERRAIKAYIKVGETRQVPVDSYEIPEGFVPHILALDEFVESRSSAYCDVMEEISRKQFELGFGYLNSSEYVSSMKESERLYREAVYMYGNDLAKRKLAEWNDQISKRDASMLENIYSFCQRADFMEGVFMVGAGHKSSITEGIECGRQDWPSVVTWRFWNEP